MKAREGAFKRKEIFYRDCGRFGCVQQIIEFDVREAASTFLTFLMAAVIDEHAPHSLGGQRESLRPAWQYGTALILQSKPSLVDRRRGLQRVIRPLASEVPPCDAPQLVVHQREKLLNRSFRRDHISSLTLQTGELHSCFFERQKIGVGVPPHGEEREVRLDCAVTIAC